MPGEYAHKPVGPLPTPFIFYISATPKSNNFHYFKYTYSLKAFEILNQGSEPH